MERVLPFAATLIVGLAHLFAWRGDPSRVWLMLAAAYVPVLLASFFYLRKQEALSPLMKPVAGDVTQGTIAAAAALLVTYGVALAAVKLYPNVVRADLTGIVRTARSVESAQMRGLALVIFAVIEEVVWRGAVTAALEPKVGSAKAPWIASGLFVLSVIPSFHPSIILAAVTLGLASAFLVKRTRRLIPACIMHAAFIWFLVEMVLRVVVDRLKAG
jgi:membrane protease YdiL (CAAX protease family)